MPGRRIERALGVLGLLGILAAVAWVAEGVRERYYPRMYRVVAFFEDARGIAEGTPVRIAGVRAGWVLGIVPPGFPAPRVAHDFTGLTDAERESRVKIVLGIFEDINLNTHRVRVASMGLIQERYLAVDVGVEPTVPRDGAAVLGELDVSLDTVGDSARRVQAIFGDTDLIRRFSVFGDELKGLLGGFDRVVTRVPDVLRRAKESIGVVAGDAGTLVERSSDAIERTRGTVAPIADDVTRAREQVDRIRGHFEAISTSAREIKAGIDAGRGTIGRLAHDATLSESLEGVSEAKTKLAYDSSRTPPMSPSTRKLLKIAKAVLFFLEPGDK